MFAPTERKYNLFNWPMVLGMLPQRLFEVVRSPCRDERFPRNGGSPPVRLLNSITKIRSFDKEMKSSGILPTKLLEPRLKNFKVGATRYSAWNFTGEHIIPQVKIL